MNPQERSLAQVFEGLPLYQQVKGLFLTASRIISDCDRIPPLPPGWEMKVEGDEKRVNGKVKLGEADLNFSLVSVEGERRDRIGFFGESRPSWGIRELTVETQEWPWRLIFDNSGRELGYRIGVKTAEGGSESPVDLQKIKQIEDLLLALLSHLPN